MRLDEKTVAIPAFNAVLPVKAVPDHRVPKRTAPAIATDTVSLSRNLYPLGIGNREGNILSGGRYFLGHKFDHVRYSQFGVSDLKYNPMRSKKTVFVDNPAALKNPDKFIEIEIDCRAALQSWRQSLYSFEWLTPGGQLKDINAMAETERIKRKAAEDRINNKEPLEKPVLGTGLMGNIEIGAGRAVFLTLADHGHSSIPVHIPKDNLEDFEPYRAPSEKGNVLIYVLIAVALLAALSFAVSESTRGTGAGVSTEKARLLATEIIEYGNVVAQATAQLRLRGCQISQLSFENNIVGGYENTNAPADNSCHIFNIAGGGVEWIDPPAEWLDASNAASDFYGEIFIPNSTCVVDVGTTSNSAAGTCDADGDEDLIMTIPWVKYDICYQINELTGMGNPGGDVPLDNALAWGTNKFQGSLGGALEIGNGPDVAVFRNQKAGCFEGSAAQAGGYHFYQVLAAQ